MGYLLNQTKKDCIAVAKRLGDYQKLTVNQLADGYCTASDMKDESLRDSYMGALLLRFWYKINELYVQNKSLELDHDDYFNWIVGAIEQACDPKNRLWQTKYTVNAQQVIIQVLNTRFKAQAYYEANLQMHKANYNMMDLEDNCGDDSDNTYLDILEDANAANDEENHDVESIVQSYINNNKIVESIIVDTIAFRAEEKHEKEKYEEVDSETGETVTYERGTRQFWAYDVIRKITNLPENFRSYFLSKYNIGTEELAAALDSIKKSTNNKLYKSLENTIESLKVVLG